MRRSRKPRSTRLDRSRPRLWRRVLPALAHLISLVLLGALLLSAQQGQWFFGDEWAFLQGRSLDQDPVPTLLRPHNEHWSTLPVLVYQFLTSTYGLHSYLPYISVLVALHLMLVHLLWNVLRRCGVSPSVAVGLPAAFAVLGAGSENLLWAFQMGFVGSVTAGVGAVLLVDHDGPPRWRDVAASLLMVAGLASSGIGVPMAVAVALTVLLRRRSLVQAAFSVLVPAATFLTWYALFGQGGSGARNAEPGEPFEIGSLPLFVYEGLANALATSTGLLGGGAVLLLGLVAVVVRRPHLLTGRTAVACAMAATAVFFFAFVGAGRIAFGVEQARSGRYVYISIALLLPLAGLALDAALERLRRPALVAVPILLAVLSVQASALLGSAERQAEREDVVRGTVLGTVALMGDSELLLQRVPEPRSSPDLTVTGLQGFLDRGWLSPDPPADQADLVSAQVRMQTAVVDDVSEPSGTTLLQAVRVLETSTEPGCVSLLPTGEMPQAVVQLDPGGGSLLMRTDTPGPFLVQLRDGERLSSPSPLQLLDTAEHGFTSLIGGTFLLTLPPAGTTTICTAA